MNLSGMAKYDPLTEEDKKANMLLDIEEAKQQGYSL